MKYLIFLSVILCVCLTTLFVSISSGNDEDNLTIPIIHITPDKPIDKPEEDIHKNDSVRIKQSVEIYYVLTEEYEVCTSLWLTYKNRLHCEANNCTVVKKHDINSEKIKQFNAVFHRYEKLTTKVKNRLMPW